ncbi:MAG: hypothetical protein J6Z49_01220 [Kiritimatiellae bacterium]|nr:hypothetical protein [Kiritimatiellia bacterium]
MNMRKLKRLATATRWQRVVRMALAAFCVAAAVPSYGVTTHYMPHAELKYSDGFIPTTGVLVFPDVTLADLEGCSYWGRIGGSSLTCAKTALSNAVQPYPAGSTGDAIQRYDFDLVSHEGDYVKSVHIQLYNGDGGVWARTTKAWNVQTGTGGMPTIHYTVNATTGELTWSGVGNATVATGPNANNYGIRAIGVARPVTTISTLAFPGLTVAAIAKNATAKFSAKMSGAWVSDWQGLTATIVNPVVSAGTAENPTAIRCEAQLLDVNTVKCAVFELTDGTGGVYVRLVGGYYKATVAIGEPLLDANGTPLSGVAANASANVPSTLLGNGYGIYNLEVNEEARIEADTSYVFDRDTYLTATAQLVFPGATLAELEGCAFYGIMDGGYVSNGDMVKESAYSHVVKRYPEDTAQAVQKLFVQMTWVGDKDMKSAIVELTDGNGGVYGRAPLAVYTKSKNITAQVFGVKDDGSGVTNYVGHSEYDVATGDHVRGYGVKKIGATRLVSGAARLAFPGKTVADIFRGEILAKTAGASMSNSDQFNDYVVCNRVITSTDATTGGITGFREELQWARGGSNPCVELRFTDGEGGVYVEAVRSCYAASPYTTNGRRMIAHDDSGKADGTTAYSIATTFWTSGYGACNLAVALPDDASTGPATATWNGGDPANTASWTCKAGDGTALADTLPDKHTQILIAANVTMTADADLTPYASIMTTAADLTIDTSGHKLYVKSLDPWHPTTITDTVGGGELHLVLPEGFQTYNNIFSLSGKLKLVKEGKGIYLAVKYNQKYSGGTEIKGGVAMPYLNGTTSLRNWSMGGDGIRNPSGQVITVSEGGTLDINGNTALGYTTFVFNGGTVYGATTQFNGVKYLTADSHLYVTDTFNIQNQSYPLDLRGHKLSVYIVGGKILNLECPITGPGTIETTYGGWLNMTSTDLTDTSVDFVIHSALDINKAISVHDYRARYNYDANTWGETAALNVYGTFTPETDYFTAATMMNGSTIDLSAKTGVWSTTSLFTNGNTLSFAEGGTVYVDLGEREMDYGSSYMVKIASWTTQPTNVKFVATNPKRYHLTQRSDGLYCLKKLGTMVIVR